MQTEKETFIAEMAFIKEAYEAMNEIYEGMSLDDLRVCYKYRPDGWERELIKSIGTKKKENGLQMQNMRKD